MRTRWPEAATGPPAAGLVCRLSIAFVKGRAIAKFWIYLCGTLRVPQDPPGPMRGRPGGAAGYRGAAREVFDWVSHMIFWGVKFRIKFLSPQIK